MAVSLPEGSEDVRATLREIVAEQGPEALSSAATLSNLLKDLLPDAPRIAKILIAAADERVGDVLLGHVSHGMDAGMAATLAASSFASATMFPPDACSWVVSEFAVALGLITDTAGPATVIGAPPERAAPPVSEPSPTPGLAAEWSPAVTGPLARGTAAPAGASPELAEVSSRPSAPRQSQDRRRGGRMTVIAVAGPLLAVAAVAAIWLSHGSGPGGTTSGRARAVTAYVISYSPSPGVPSTITPISLATGIPGARIEIQGHALAVAITPDGKTVYVGTDLGTVIPISTATNTVGPAIKVRANPALIVITPDGKTAYVLIAGPAGSTVIPISTATNPGLSRGSADERRA